MSECLTHMNVTCCFAIWRIFNSEKWIIQLGEVIYVSKSRNGPRFYQTLLCIRTKSFD